MNILILAGGTGSIALQTGLYQTVESVVGKENIDIKILTNAYDNGLSTGLVRKVMNGNILGPSDVRKNQTTRLQLEKPDSPWLDYLNIRFTMAADKVYMFCHGQTNDLEEKLSRNVPEVHDAIKAFFDCPMAHTIDYNDFSLANIIYAGLAKMNNNSLRAAAKIMAGLFGIKDNVILNDDTSLFLGAISRSGVKVADEGDIVCWGKKDDPFEDVFFTDASGNESFPLLCEEAYDAIVSADLIILSSGTQWSSLIPTYASVGFARAIEDSRAKVIMIMNREPDKDSPGQTADDIISQLVPKYFAWNTLHVICDSSSSYETMAQLNPETITEIAGFYPYKIGAYNNRLVSNNGAKHYPPLLAKAVSEVFWGVNKKMLVDANTQIVFDYDDTLVGRGNTFTKASLYNAKALNALNQKLEVCVCTGNSIKAVKLGVYEPISANGFNELELNNGVVRVFADGGVNEYVYYSLPPFYTPDKVNCLSSQSVLSKPELSLIYSRLKEAGIPISKIENRGDIMIAVKPIDPEYRFAVTSLLEYIFDVKSNSSWSIKPTGRTTIEISKKGISKATTIEYLQKEARALNIIYVGDELAEGNDSPVAEMHNPALTCISVKSPNDTAYLMSVLLNIYDTYIL